MKAQRRADALSSYIRHILLSYINLFGYFMRESEDMPMRNNIDELIDGLIAREGGFVDHPADKGRPTRWSITQSVARRHGYMGQMENLPCNVAALI